LLVALRVLNVFILPRWALAGPLMVRAVERAASGRQAFPPQTNQRGEMQSSKYIFKKSGLPWREKYGQPILSFFLWTSITVMTMDWFYARWELEELKISGNDRLKRLESQLQSGSS